MANHKSQPRSSVCHDSTNNVDCLPSGDARDVRTVESNLDAMLLRILILQVQIRRLQFSNAEPTQEYDVAKLKIVMLARRAFNFAWGYFRSARRTWP
jgi:hypothetical protein